MTRLICDKNPPHVLREYCKHGWKKCSGCLHFLIKDEKKDEILCPECRKYPATKPPAPINPFGNEDAFVLTAPFLCAFSGEQHGEKAKEELEQIRNYRGPQIEGMPVHFCEMCQLNFVVGVEPYYAKHPSHRRRGRIECGPCIVVRVDPVDYRLVNESTQFNTILSYGKVSKFNTEFGNSSRNDLMNNFDNIDIIGILELIRYLNIHVIRERTKMMYENTYTNSADFASITQRLSIVVLTAMKVELLQFLLKAHKLKFDSIYKSFLETDEKGRIIKEYHVSPLRFNLIFGFIQKVRDLTSLGIQLHWKPTQPVKLTVDARQKFLREALHLPPLDHDRLSHRKRGNSAQDMDTSSLRPLDLESIREDPDASLLESRKLQKTPRPTLDPTEPGHTAYFV
ncbi:hypothetical protein F4778DRAFT_727738 [Xylariomycetidae sp. FL2044]|nr:hypothetical protein F4778DRAFT_727738 [Xylariomycetidae sp. FL2044]